MVKLVISFAIGFAAAFGVIAQTPTGTPQSQPTPGSTPPPSPNQAVPATTRMRTADQRMLQQQFPLNPVSESDRLSSRVTRLAYLVAPLYKKPSGKELAAILPDKAIEGKYSNFLGLNDTGIVKLVPDSGCVYSDRVVNVKQECLKYPFPGAGNSYSFRTEGYRLRHLADLTYVDDKLRMTGIFMHSIAVELGDVPIETASLSTDGIQYLTGFEPSTTAEDVAAIDSNLTKGVKFGDFVYSKEVDPRVDRTYALRAVAYRGKVVRAAGGVRYNELDYDKRRDVIVVFRVVQIEKDGITLVWRKLADVEPPRIKMPKAEKEADDGEAN
jgi:hypothetical protein